MKVKAKILIIIFPFFFYSCAKIPIQSIALADAIMDEGNRMHQLNITLINKMFKEKREKIDVFIKKEYTPKYLEEFKKKIPAGVNVEEELPNILQSIIPVINSRRDSMQSALENQRVKLVTALEQNYKSYENASVNLKDLLKSAVKVNEARQKAFNQAKELSNSKIDLNQIENSIDGFITDSGNISKNILTLNKTINAIINN